MRNNFLILIGSFILFGSPFTINEHSGFITGNAKLANGDFFPIIVHNFEISISDFKNESHQIEVKIPLKVVSTDNWLRDIIMKISVFDKSKGDIQFRFKYNENLKFGYPNGNVNLLGDLTINGITNPVFVNLEFYNKNDKSFVKGNAKISLNKFNIEAPGFSAFKVQDEVNIIFDLSL